MIKTRIAFEQLISRGIGDTIRVSLTVPNSRKHEEIEAVSDLIRSEVNVKELELLDDASGILVKSIKPNFKTLGPKYGKDMKAIAAAVAGMQQEDIQKMEREGEFELHLENKSLILQLEDVVISSQDIEGWLVASSGAITVALDITIDESIKSK